MNALALIRVSTDEQADSGLGLQAQRERINSFCVAKGWTLLQTYEELGVSAGKPLEKRPIASAMLRRARKEKLVVVVLKLDRLFRSVADAAQVIAECDDGFSLVSVSECFDMTHPMGRAMAQMASVFAELERAMIRERTRAAMGVKRARGERVSRIPPFGKDFVPTGRFVERDGESHEVLSLQDSPSEQETLRLLRLWHSNGRGYEEMARTLNSTNTPTKTGSLWTRATVRQILKRVC